MKRNVAVGAYRDKVLCRVDYMLACGNVEGYYMVHLNDAGELRSVCLCKVKAADCADGSMSSKTCLSGNIVALIAVERDLHARSLEQSILLVG